MVEPKIKPTPRTKTDPRARAVDRINRLAGQARALAAMTERGDDWKKLLTLAAAIEGAADQVTAELYQGYLESLIEDKDIAAKAREGLNLVLKRL
jgi:DNA-binding FrmR family transcriptional regulator